LIKSYLSAIFSESGKGDVAMATILIVESYPNLASLYYDILSEQGHRVLVASDLKEANALAAANEIDLVIMDEKLPNGGEEELTEKIKTIQPHVKGIVCPLDQFNQKAYRSLCDAGFLKSSDYTILQKKIENLARKISDED
jgi:DNA-binding NtrC family response regulator